MHPDRHLDLPGITDFPGAYWACEQPERPFSHETLYCEYCVMCLRVLKVQYDAGLIKPHIYFNSWDKSRGIYANRPIRTIMETEWQCCYDTACASGP